MNVWKLCNKALKALLYQLNAKHDAASKDTRANLSVDSPDISKWCHQLTINQMIVETVLYINLLVHLLFQRCFVYPLQWSGSLCSGIWHWKCLSLKILYLILFYLTKQKFTWRTTSEDTQVITVVKKWHSYINVCKLYCLDGTSTKRTGLINCG